MPSLCSFASEATISSAIYEVWTLDPLFPYISRLCALKTRYLRTRTGQLSIGASFEHLGRIVRTTCGGYIFANEGNRDKGGSQTQCRSVFWLQGSYSAAEAVPISKIRSHRSQLISLARDINWLGSRSDSIPTTHFTPLPSYDLYPYFSFP